MPENFNHVFGHRLDYLIMIVFGSVAHTAWQIQKSRLNKTLFTFVDGVISLIIAMFSGTMFGMVTLAAGQGELAVIISVSIGSWLGITGLNFLASRFMRGQ